MNKKLYPLLILIVSIFIVFLLSTTSYAGTQKLKNLEYEAKLNSDGSMDVTENWNIRVEETNTLFKTFDLDSTKYGSIVDVEVSEITKDGSVVPFENTGVYQYHVKKGGFYALTRSIKEFEIAWGVSIEDTETRTYQIKYKVNDAIKNYNDCSELYWQFIGRTNGIPVDKIKGTILLPREVSNTENLKVWAHGPLNGTIHIIDNKTVEFEVEKLETNQMVEVRIVTLDNIFTLNNNNIEINKLNNILSEETKWADEANRQRNINNAIWLSVVIVGIAICVFFVLKIIHYAKVLSNTKIIKPEIELKYFRDFPDETATPAEAAFIYYFDRKTAFKTNVSKIVSATMLNLALKKAISFRQDEKNNVYIILNKDFDSKSLKEDEKNIYDILVNTNNSINKKDKNDENKQEISMKDIEKYAKKSYKTFLSKIESLEKLAEKSEEEKQNFDTSVKKLAEKWSTKSAMYYVFAFFSLSLLTIFIPIILMPVLVVCGILSGKIAKRLRTLTQKGVNEKEEWKGLKRYMEDFSLLNEREVPELALWEKYLVFATAFGISDKVLSQLKVRYPEIADENYMTSHGYTYMYMAGRMNFDRMVLSGMQKAYSAGISERASREYSSRRRGPEEDSLEEAGGGRWWPAGMGGR